MAAVDVTELAVDLRSLVSQLTRRFRAVATSDENGVSITQYLVLLRLSSEPGMTGAELARAQAVRPQSMNTAVTELREKGLLVSRSNPLDGRRRELELTASGRVLLDRIGASRTGWLVEQLRTRFEPDELRTVADALQILRRLQD